MWGRKKPFLPILCHNLQASSFDTYNFHMVSYFLGVWTDCGPDE